MQPASPHNPLHRHGNRARRWRRRGLGVVAAALVVGGLAACEPVLSLEVDTATDGVDVAPGDGVCATAQGTCTLRAAISEANATPGFHRITILAGIDPVLSIAGASENANATGDLDVTGDIEILGQGATIDGADLDRVFDVVGGHLRLHDVTITGGVIPGVERGSALRSAARLDLHRAIVTGNGPAAIQSFGQSLTITESTLEDDTAWNAPLLADHGSVSVIRSVITAEDGIRAGGSAHLTLLDSTVRAEGFAVRFWDDSTGSIVRSTLHTRAEQFGHPLIMVDDGTVRVGGSVLDAPNADETHQACTGTGTVISEGYNVFPDATCGAGPGDAVDVDALLEPLGDYGGPTDTMRPHANSPAVGRVPAGTPLCSDWIPIDQRGAPRPAATDCTAGAVEAAGVPAVPAHLVVDTPTDGVDADPGDGACATAGGACTLRAAVMEANATHPHLPNLDHTITVAPGVDPTLTIAGAGEDLGATGDLDITTSLTIHGNGATVHGSGLDRVLDHDAPRLTLTDLTLVGGSVTGDGGAIRSVSGSVDATDVTIHHNQATGSGGGLASYRLTGVGLHLHDNTAGVDGGGLITTHGDLTATTLASNQAAGRGGGAAIRITATFTRSALHGNTAATGGGASSTAGGDHGPMTFVSSTISGNHGGSASAAYSQLGPVRLDASTVVGNTGAPAIIPRTRICSGLYCNTWTTARASGSIILGSAQDPACTEPLTAISSGNLAPDGSCGATLAGAGDLGPLANNGGPTLTHLPLAGSGAIDAIAPGTPALCDGTIATDQRGVTRPTGTGCDVGAVEQ